MCSGSKALTVLKFHKSSWLSIFHGLEATYCGMSWIVNPENMRSKNSNWFRRGRPMDGALKSPFQMELRDWLRPSLWALMLFVEIFDCIEMIWHFEFLQVLFIAWIFTITFFRSNKDSRKEPWVHSAPVTTHCPHLSYFAPPTTIVFCIIYTPVSRYYQTCLRPD